MRKMSFMLTTDQIRNRTKTVTRRVGWQFLKPGDLIRAVERCQGLKKGEKMQPLAVLRVVGVSRERLDRMEVEAVYGQSECVAEGFPSMSPMEFVAMFCATHKIPDTRVWGLPKAYKFTGKREEIVKQIGNSWPGELSLALNLAIAKDYAPKKRAKKDEAAA